MATLSHCTRCGGFIIPEVIRDVGADSFGWRCLLCGDVIDGVILRNRVGLFIADPLDDEDSAWADDSLTRPDELEIG